MKNRWFRLAAIALIALVAVLAVRAYFGRDNLTEVTPDEEINAELTLQAVTLEQPDENGELLWRLKAKSVTYTPDNQRAQLASLEGEFFQSGETVYTVVADEGEVQQNGKTLFLRGNLIATSLSNELTVEGDKLKWQPKQDLLVMGAFEGGDFVEEVAVESDTGESDAGEDKTRDADARDADDADSSAAEDRFDGAPEGRPDSRSDGKPDSKNGDETFEASAAPIVLENPVEQRSFEALLAESNTAQQLSEQQVNRSPVTGFNPQVEAIAQAISISNKGNDVQLLGGVAAKSKETPWLTFEADQLDWFTDRDVIESDGPIKVEQYASEAYETITDRVVGAIATVQLASNIITLDDSMQLESFTQPLKVVSQTAVWNVAAQSVVLDKPVEIEQPAQKITASANSANLDLQTQLVTLNGNVQANGEENDAQLNADQVQWQTDSQEVEATGNVIYQQAADPEVYMTGAQAFGDLDAGTLVVTGGESGEVVTEFVPGEPL